MSKHQYAMVMDLNKCLGCQTCTMACKKLWTDRDGTGYMYWNNVETRPGLGYPRQWDRIGGGLERRRTAAQPAAQPWTTTASLGIQLRAAALSGQQATGHALARPASPAATGTKTSAA